jgi:hypothetical protein
MTKYEKLVRDVYPNAFIETVDIGIDWPAYFRIWAYEKEKCLKLYDAGIQTGFLILGYDKVKSRAWLNAWLRTQEIVLHQLIN